MDMIADSLNPFKFIARQWAKLQGFESLTHLVDLLGSCNTEIYGLMVHYKTVAILSNERFFAGRHFAWIEQIAPTGCRLSHDAVTIYISYGPGHGLLAHRAPVKIVYPLFESFFKCSCRRSVAAGHPEPSYLEPGATQNSESILIHLLTS